MIIRLFSFLILLTSCGFHDHSAKDGANGKNCEVSTVSNGAIIKCEESSAVVLNGADAPTVNEITEIIDPCGPGSGFQEVLLRLGSNKLLAHYASGSLQFLTVLTPGTYRTTDSQSCTFVVHNDYSVSW